MAWNRKGVTYVVTDAPCYEVADGETVVDRYLGAEPMAGSRSFDFLLAADYARHSDGRVVSIFEETKTLHGGYMARLLWQEVRDEF